MRPTGNCCRHGPGRARTWAATSTAGARNIGVPACATHWLAACRWPGPRATGCGATPCVACCLSWLARPSALGRTSTLPITPERSLPRRMLPVPTAPCSGSTPKTSRPAPTRLPPGRVPWTGWSSASSASTCRPGRTWLAAPPLELRAMPPDGPVRLYWFSQTIGLGRGLEDVIQAMGQLKGCNIELHVRGRWAGRYKEALFSLATSVGVLHQQICSHDPEPQSEMIRLATIHDVGLALERKDTENHDLCIANKIFTYLLAGNAVIATATRGQQLIIDRKSV